MLIYCLCKIYFIRQCEMESTIIFLIYSNHSNSFIFFRRYTVKGIEHWIAFVGLVLTACKSLVLVNFSCVKSRFQASLYLFVAFEMRHTSYPVEVMPRWLVMWTSLKSLSVKILSAKCYKSTFVSTVCY